MKFEDFVSEVRGLLEEKRRLVGTKGTMSWESLVRLAADEDGADVQAMLHASGCTIRDMRRLIGLPPDEDLEKERARELAVDSAIDRKRAAPE